MSDITKEELSLLMDSHKESVKLNTELIGKIDNILEVQRKTCSGVDKLCDKIDHQTSTLSEFNMNLGEKVVDIKTDNVKEHSSIKNRIYLAFGLMATIIIELIVAILKGSIP